MHLGRKIWDLGTYLSRSTKYETCWIYLFRPRSRPAKRSARCGGIFIQTCCSEVFHLVEPWLAGLVQSELESPWQRRIVTYQEFISRKSNYEQMGNIGFYFFFLIMKILILKKKTNSGNDFLKTASSVWAACSCYDGHLCPVVCVQFPMRQS